MNFALSDEQEFLREAARGALSRHKTIEAARDALENPEAMPDLWPTAVDEVLRVESPVSRTARRARRDTEVAGEEIPEGALVVTVLGGANRDPGVFPEPALFDVGRVNAREHVAFSSGIHYCLGAALARMEGEVALRALFERFPDLAPAGRARRRPTRILRGYEAMPVRPGPARREPAAPAVGT